MFERCAVAGAQLRSSAVAPILVHASRQFAFCDAERMYPPYVYINQGAARETADSEAALRTLRRRCCAALYAAKPRADGILQAYLSWRAPQQPSVQHRLDLSGNSRVSPNELCVLYCGVAAV